MTDSAEPPIGFGDNVRVRVTTETEKAGVAGLHGQTYGMTTPSITGVTVIGDLKADYALNVHFVELDESLWFAPELLELLDRAPGTEATVGSKRFVRSEDGDWEEVGASEEDAPGDVKKRPSWKFW